MSLLFYANNTVPTCSWSKPQCSCVLSEQTRMFLHVIGSNQNVSACYLEKPQCSSMLSGQTTMVLHVIGAYQNVSACYPDKPQRSCMFLGKTRMFLHVFGIHNAPACKKSKPHCFYILQSSSACFWPWCFRMLLKQTTHFRNAYY